MLNFPKYFLLEQVWGEVLFFLGIYDILQEFYTKLLRQLPWRISIKTIIIRLTKQIKIPKKVDTFLGKFPWWSIVFINSKCNITEVGLQHWQFSWKFNFFWNCRAHNPACRAHGIFFFCSWDPFLVFDTKPLLYSLLEPAPNRNSEEQLSGNYRRKKSVGKLPF